jgi:microcin C transport system ATP-binding protein
MTLLHVDNLGVNFRRPGGADTGVVKNVSFALNQGETLALVGESGSGKSVTALSILGLLPYPMAYHPTGSIHFMEQELLNKGDVFLRQIRGRDIGMIFQEPMTALNPLHTIEKQIAESLIIHKGLTTTKAQRRVIELLDMVGFPEAKNRLNAYPHQLSGGQRQRVMIAMALACEPKLLIADEPTTALDVTIQAGIIQLLQDLQKRLNMGLILISHDLGMVAKVADHIAVMREGVVVEQGLKSEVLQRPSHPYTKTLVEAEPSGAPHPIQADAPIILTAEKIRVAFQQKKRLFQRRQPDFEAVKDISLTLKQGETLGIVGESGSGKSTLAYALLRLVESRGKIVFCNQSIDSWKQKQLRALRAKMQIIFQDPFSSLNPRLSIGQIVAEGLEIHSTLTPSEIDQRVIGALKDVGLPEDVRFRYPHEFSGGQRQRVAIARALILHPNLLILDEPTSALDRSIQAEVIELLRELQVKYQLSYLFISHDLKVVRAMSHRILVMQNGAVVENGEAHHIIEHPTTEYGQRLMRAAFAYEV